MNQREDDKQPVINVVGYIRESTPRQGMHGFRPAEQKKIIQSYCNLHNFEPVQFFEDWKSGGTAAGRDAFQQMVEYVKQNDIRFIVVAETSRLFRNFEETLNFERELESEYGVFAVDTRIDYNPREYLDKGISNSVWEQRMYERLAAERFRRTLSHNVREGQSGKRSVGGWLGPLSYGIEWCDDSKKFVRYTEDAKDIIKECYKLYLMGGKGFKAIADELNGRGCTWPDIEIVRKQREDNSWSEERKTVHKPFTFTLCKTF